MITKHPGTGGLVSVDTVTAQLLYEIAGARYANPDVTLRIDTIELTDDGPDRVRISGVGGEPPPPTLKVSLNSIGGFRNAMTFVLTGLDIEAKAELVRRQLEAAPDGQARRAASGRWPAPTIPTPTPRRPPARCCAAWSATPTPPTSDANSPRPQSNSRWPAIPASPPPRRRATVRCTACSPPGYVDAARGAARRRARRRHAAPTSPPATETLATGTRRRRPRCPSRCRSATTRRAPLGTIAGARSGDKGGSANVGVWVRTDEQWRWLAHTLTVEKLRELLPETADLPVTRHLLPNLRAVNFVIEGILGQGVAYQARFDPQAKGLGEWLRSTPRRHPGGVCCREHLDHARTRGSCERRCATFAEREVLPHVDEWERTGELPRDLHRKAGDAGCSARASRSRSAAGAATAPTR